MKMNVKYFDNEINLSNDNIYSIEIENKKYFYRLVRDLYEIEKGNTVEDIDFSEEKSFVPRIKIFLNFFDFDFNSKKYINEIINNISEEERDKILKTNNKLLKELSIFFNNLDLPITIEDDFTIDNILKMFKIKINCKEELLDNLLLLIDLEKELNSNNILFFVNLKQYLIKEEIKEFYKYSIYNQIKIVMIDSQSYGVNLDNEKKLIIDDNLDEFML